MSDTMKKTNRKMKQQPQPQAPKAPLALNTETVRPLDPKDLEQASGARSGGCYY